MLNLPEAAAVSEEITRKVPTASIFQKPSEPSNHIHSKILKHRIYNTHAHAKYLVEFRCVCVCVKDLYSTVSQPEFERNWGVIPCCQFSAV